MTLTHFLSTHTPVTAVELLPDNRLINVVIDGEALYGVDVDDIPTNAQVTRVPASFADDTITTDTGLTFLAAEYTMLGSDTEPSV
jgi:hypothetical protein